MNQVAGPKGNGICGCCGLWFSFLIRFGCCGVYGNCGCEFARLRCSGGVTGPCVVSGIVLWASTRVTERVVRRVLVFAIGEYSARITSS